MNRMLQWLRHGRESHVQFGLQQFIHTQATILSTTPLFIFYFISTLYDFHSQVNFHLIIQKDVVGVDSVIC